MLLKEKQHSNPVCLFLLLGQWFSIFSVEKNYYSDMRVINGRFKDIQANFANKQYLPTLKPNSG